jgi:steroid delta-isomerase-like uncharacterized protein
VAEDNKSIMQRAYDEILNEGNLELADEIVAEDLTEHEQFPGLEPGREGFKGFVTMFREAFPDLQVTVEDMIAEGDRVAARVTMRGTHQGEFLGIAGTGNRIEVPGVDIVRFSDGMAVEHWGVTDNMALMVQLGAADPTAIGG